jgi:hypothetical protein
VAKADEQIRLIESRRGEKKRVHERTRKSETREEITQKKKNE